MKPKSGAAIRHARIKAGVSQGLAGQAIGRSQFWISKVESGEIRLDCAATAKILEAIKRLGAMQKRSIPRPIFEDLALPGRVEAAHIRRNTLQGKSEL